MSIQGSGFTPLALIEIYFAGEGIDAVAANSQGQFSIGFEVPEFTSAGTTAVTAIQASVGADEVTAEFEVINTPPVADPHAPVVVEENSSELISLTASDVNGDTLTLVLVSDPSHGSVPEIDEDTGEVVYIPDAGYTGSDSFSFKANDGAADSNISTVSVTVTPAEISDEEADITVSTQEDNDVTITLEAAGLDSAPVSFEVISDPDHGTLGEVESAGAYAAKVEYTPEEDFSGNDGFTFRATDSESASITGTVSITVNGVNDAPVAISKSLAVNENSKKKIVLEAFDADEDSLSYSIVSPPDHGTLTGSPPEVFYEPDEDYTGSDDFKFTASDSQVSSGLATITISVESNYNGYSDDYYDEEDDYRDDTNLAPVASSQSVSGMEDAPVGVKLGAYDSNGDSLTFSIIEYPVFGQVIEFNETSGELTYIPDPEFSGADSFTFFASDGHKKSKKATVSILIEMVNDPPRPISMNITAPDGTANITLSALDPEGDSLQFAIYTEPASGMLSGVPPEVAYTADEGFAGYDKFLFTVNDGNRPDSRIGVVSILVGDAASVVQDDGHLAKQPPVTDTGGSPVEEKPAKDAGQSGQDHGKGNPDEKKSTERARADKSKIVVELSWDHKNKEKEIESTLHLRFSDHKSREDLSSHIWYDLVMLDEQNNEILRKQDLIALDSQDVQQVTFPANGTYHFEVNVKGLVDKSTNEITRGSDYTGKALGIVVVPEFSLSWVLMVVVAAITSSVLLFARNRCNFGSAPSRQF
jgi:hypothetical protein